MVQLRFAWWVPSRQKNYFLLTLHFVTIRNWSAYISLHKVIIVILLHFVRQHGSVVQWLALPLCLVIVTSSIPDIANFCPLTIRNILLVLKSYESLRIVSHRSTDTSTGNDLVTAGGGPEFESHPCHLLLL